MSSARSQGSAAVARTALPDGAPWRFRSTAGRCSCAGPTGCRPTCCPAGSRDEDYDRLLGQARAAGINFLRVWGGGVREKRAFWDACDRLGILAWQEFPLACAFLDHYPRDPAYLTLLEDEARGSVQLLRNHPSLLAWCGGNEINPEREAQPLARLACVVQEEDPDRPWIPASPSAGDRHNWHIWHGFAPWTALSEGDPPFLSEFGLQALPVAETLAEMFPDGAPERLDDPLGLHAWRSPLNWHTTPDRRLAEQR